MRKALKVIGVFILVLFIFLIGFLKYREYRANNALIPVETATLIKVNADQIIQTFALNVPFNLNHYVKSSKRNKKRKSKLDLPVNIPASVYLYTLKTYGCGTFFSRFDIGDYNAFTKFIGTNASLQSVPSTGTEMQWAKSPDGKLTICYNKGAVAVSYSLDKKDVKDVLPEILLQMNFISVGKSAFKEQLKKKDHLIFAGDGITGILNFKNGEIEAEISWLTNHVIPAPRPVYQTMTQNGTAFFWLNADLKDFPPKEFSFKEFTIQTDSLFKYYNGYLDFEWRDVIKQTDTIITYEYNDDFEKVEIRSVQENKIPSFQVSLKSDSKKLMTYLEKENLLDTNTMLINTKAFPLFPLYVSEKGQELLIGTDKQKTDERKKVSTDYFMQLSLNFKKLKAEYKLPFISDWISKWDELKVTGKALAPDTVLIKGKISFSNLKINSFYQLSND